MDQKIIEKAKKALASKKRYHVELSDILAVVERESEGVPYFNEGDHLFQFNLADAVTITGYSQQHIRDAIVIPGGGPLGGKLAKFRCERDYWDWAKARQKVDDHIRFLLACSVGLGQKMVKLYISNFSPMAQWPDKIHNFMGSENEQLAYVAGDLEKALAEMNDDRVRAFARYNAGRNPVKLKAAIATYGEDVAARAQRFKKSGL